MKPRYYLVLLVILTSCNSGKLTIESKARQRMKLLDKESRENINVLLEMIAEQKLASEKRYIPYEFRIPLDSMKRKQVHQIDTSVYFTDRTNTYQCISDNATREKVLQIVALPYAKRIRYCPFE